MKIKTTVAALALSLFSAGFSTSVSAHDLKFKILSASNGAGATDVWEVSCLNSSLLGDTARLVAQVRDFSPADSNLVSLIIYKDGKAASTTDLSAGDAGYSPLVSVNAGNGVYTMMANHTKVGNQVYFIEYHCENAAGDHTPSTVPSTPVQDQ